MDGGDCNIPDAFLKSVGITDMGSITCKCNRLQLQLLWNFMITDYNYNYFFLNVINYNYRLHCKEIMITL